MSLILSFLVESSGSLWHDTFCPHGFSNSHKLFYFKPCDMGITENLVKHSFWCRHREQTHGHSWGRRGWKNWESSTEAYTLPYVKLDSGNLLCGIRSSNLVLCDNLRGGMGWDVGRRLREGPYIYLWMIHVDVGQKPTQYYKAIILQLKINKFKFKK